MLETQMALAHERPFSFVAQEQARVSMREETFKMARDPNRFQVGARVYE